MKIQKMIPYRLTTITSLCLGLTSATTFAATVALPNPTMIATASATPMPITTLGVYTDDDNACVSIGEGQNTRSSSKKEAACFACCDDRLHYMGKSALEECDKYCRDAYNAGKDLGYNPIDGYVNQLFPVQVDPLQDLPVVELPN